jgi:hypothetical protein
MQRNLALFSMSWLLTVNLPAAAAPGQVLSTTANCPENLACVFDGASMFVELTLTNNSGKTIGVPLEFLNQVGPHPRLIDNQTGEKISARCIATRRRHSRKQVYVDTPLEECSGSMNIFLRPQSRRSGNG